MAVAKVAEWRKLPLSLAELCIDTTLRCGQSFRWRKVGDEWHCSLHGRVVSLRQDATHLHYRATWPEKRDKVKGKGKKKSIVPPSSLLTPPSSVKADVDEEELADDDTESLLRHYFNLSLSLEDLYRQWSDADANFRRKAPKFTGVRILNQDAWEALVAFICSSNNNIARISQMVQKLCDYYGGDPIATVAGHLYRDFPSPEALAVPGVEARLRELGFGYRAKYIAETARMVALERPTAWLLSLRNPVSPAWGGREPESKADAGRKKDRVVKIERQGEEEENDEAKPSYRAAHAALLELTGVGPKVADCACLMGLGWGEAVPLDTHMLQIAARDYRLSKRTGKSNSLSKAMYDAVGDHFRGIWGPQAGWAQSVLFTANLRAFSDRLADKGGQTAESAIVELTVEDSGTTTTATAVHAGAALLMPPPAPERPTKRKSRGSQVKIEVNLDDGSDLTTGVGATRRSKRRRT